MALALDAAQSRVVVADFGLRALLAVRLSDGERSFISRDEPASAANLLVEPTGMALDAANGRLLVSDQGLDALLAVDLTTTERTIVSSGTTPNATNPFRRPRSVVLDPVAPRAFVLDEGQAGVGPPAILAVELANGARTVLSNPTTPNAITPLQVPIDMTLHAARSRLLVTERDYRAVLGVHVTTGARTIVSDDTTPDANSPFAHPKGIAVHAAQDRALVASSGFWTFVRGPLGESRRRRRADRVIRARSSRQRQSVHRSAAGRARRRAQSRLRRRSASAALYQVDLTTGMRTIVSSNSVRENPFDNVSSMSYDSDRDLVFVMNGNAAAVLAVDVPTGQRVYLLR